MSLGTWYNCQIVKYLRKATLKLIMEFSCHFYLYEVALNISSCQVHGFDCSIDKGHFSIDTVGEVLYSF